MYGWWAEGVYLRIADLVRLESSSFTGLLVIVLVICEDASLLHLNSLLENEDSFVAEPPEIII